MAGALTQDQQQAIQQLKPHELKISFSITPSAETEAHSLIIACKESEGQKLLGTLTELLSTTNGEDVAALTIPATNNTSMVYVSIHSEKIPKNGKSPVKEVAIFLADNGVNFPGSEALRTKTRPM